MKSNLYMAFRFAMYLPESEQCISVAEIYSTADSICIRRGHVEDEPTLYERLAGITSAEIWMYQRDFDRSARSISVSWASVIWFPFNLNATSAEVAMEIITLNEVKYGARVDVPRGEFPAAIVAERRARAVDKSTK